MSKIQTKQCLQCNQNKEGITFIILNNRGKKQPSKHYCWGCQQQLIEKEITQSEVWERNKKKIFSDALKKCKNKEVFEWPWREWEVVGPTTNPWEKGISSICKQCNVPLTWDVTPYEDSARHLCSYCSNCNKMIEGKKQSEHFEWNENLPIYKCEKKELIKPSKYYKQPNCLQCDLALLEEQGKLLSSVSGSFNYESVYSFANIRPNAKAHCMVSTKRHIEDLREITLQEWNEILPCLKDTVAKIDRVYKPAGYRINIPTGTLGNQNSPHFYMRLVPKYSLPNYGSVTYPVLSEKTLPGVKEEFKKIVFGVKEGNIVAERSKVIAELLHRQLGVGENISNFTIFISTKEDNTNSIQKIDPETWSQMGEVMIELMSEIENQTKFDCHDFIFSSYVGLETWEIWEKELEMSREDDPEVAPANPEVKKYYNKFCFTLFPKVRRIREENWGGRKGRPTRKKTKKALGSMESDRIAEKLRDPEGYYAKWKSDPHYLQHKAEKHANDAERESVWKQPSTYLIFASGAGIALLGIGIYYWFRKRRNQK